jgi:hypothetical protein
MYTRHVVGCQVHSISSGGNLSKRLTWHICAADTIAASGVGNDLPAGGVSGMRNHWHRIMLLFLAHPIP